jgi:hypothetical protein
VGLAARAAIDSVLDESAPMPDPAGVRLVADIVPGSPDVAGLLRAAGAKNVREIYCPSAGAGR